jgi:kynurenine 3-monooxygenase
MNAAFEDCVVLDAALRSSAGDWERAFADYEAARKRHADALADLALENFLEMRDRVASPAFRAQKRLEHLLARLFPRRFLPLYWMVSFSRLPYDDARRRARRQWRIVRRAALGAAAALVILAIGLLWVLRSG